jgi:hypothetical protein
MALATAGQNAAAAGVAGVIGFLSLHTGDPSTTGANEATGGSPAYARKAVTWAAPGSGQAATGTSAVTFDVPAGTYLWVGGFTLVTAGVWEGAAPLGGAIPFPATVVASTEVFTSTGHGLVNNDRAVVFDYMGVGVPAGLVEGTTYFVVGVSGATFQLSLTSGGAAVNVTADGQCWVQKSVPETFTGQGQLSIPIGSGIIDARAA